MHNTTQLYLADVPVEWVCDQSGEQGHGTPLFLVGTCVGRFQDGNQRLHRAFTVKNRFFPTQETILTILKNNDFLFKHTHKILSNVFRNILI